MYPRTYRPNIIMALLAAALLFSFWSFPGDVSGVEPNEPAKLMQTPNSTPKALTAPERNRAVTPSRQKLEIPDQVVIGILWLLSNY